MKTRWPLKMSDVYSMEGVVIKSFKVRQRAVIFLLATFVFNHSLFANSLPEYLSPKSSCDQLIEHPYYRLCYASNHRLSLWTLHYLDSSFIEGSTSRTDDYRLDPLVLKGVEERDYKGSGFDRGHLVPAADMRLNYKAMPGFNRGIWQSLERLVRRLVLQRGPAFIITAPILNNGLTRLKKNISIPQEFYKIVYWPKKREAIAFLIPNESQSGQSPRDFQVSVDQIENLTSLDFFWHLEDGEEDILEAQILTF
jgi:endonuclease G